MCIVAPMQRKTKIIATLGPAVASADRVDQLVAAGADVARLNFSHGEHATHLEFIEWVRAAADSQGRAVAIMQDVQGPRIRVGTFPGGSVELENGAVVTLEAGDGVGSTEVIYIENIEKAHLEVGTTVLLADGLITLEMLEVGGTLRAKVTEGGQVKDHKGAAFPGVAVDLPAITEKDIDDLAFGMMHGVDLVAASFVSTAEHIRSIREQVEVNVPIIAKIESLIAYRNLDEILSEADGVMVARGDLGVDISLEKLPRIQKNILRRANEAGKITITATEMLESMTSSSRPTRAEVTDVANAVLDGSDAVMLSAETAVGKYPMRTVRAMDLICKEAEKNPEYGRGLTGLLHDDAAFASAVALSAVRAADNLGIGTIVAFTESGSTARLISKYRPKARIVAFTPIERTYHNMALLAGTVPRNFMRLESTDEMIACAGALLCEAGLAEPGEAVVMVAGVPPNERASTNLMKLHVIGSGTAGMSRADE